MRVYIGNIGHIKNHENFKILFWSPESEKTIFTICPDFFTRKIRNTGISSETTIPGISSETTETRESSVARVVLRQLELHWTRETMSYDPTILTVHPPLNTINGGNFGTPPCRL